MRKVLASALALALVPVSAQAEVKTSAEFQAELRGIFGGPGGGFGEVVKGLVYGPMIMGMAVGVHHQRTCTADIKAEEKPDRKGMANLAEAYGLWLDDHPDERQRDWVVTMPTFLMEAMGCVPGVTVRWPSDTAPPPPSVVAPTPETALPPPPRDPVAIAPTCAPRPGARPGTPGSNCK